MAIDIPSGPFVVKAFASLFLVLFVVRVTKKAAWKQRFGKQLGLSALWFALLCTSSVFVYGNYEDAKGMIFKNVVSSESVKRLREDIDSGVNVDITDEEGMTPLMLSVYRNSLPNVKFLLSRGANPNRTNSHGLSAVDIANECGNPEMIALFRRPVGMGSSNRR